MDLHDADIVTDLATPAGRHDLVEAVTSRTEVVDAVIANAGVMGRGADTVRINYFGAVATLEGLRPLLARSDAPRAAVTASLAVVQRVDDELVGACLAGDEDRAVGIVDEAVPPLDAVTEYASTKRALARWVRANAPSAEWAGAGIALNAVGPGIVRTPMTEPLLAEPSLAELLEAGVPMPLGGVADPSAIATVLAFLTDAATTHVTGQVLFVDGGADCVLRGDDVFGQS